MNPRLHLLPLACLAALAAPSSRAAALNDSGQTTCIVAEVVTSDCAASGQDAANGRDVSQPDSANGQAGFAFAKVGADGRSLPASAAEWACVKDRVTGRLWEAKTQGGLHDAYTAYTNLGNGQPGDASALVAQTNAERLCGVATWRLPTRGELHSLVDYGMATPGVAIDTRWFPHTDAGPTWAATTDTDPTNYRWYVEFYRGASQTYWRSYRYPARLVSGTLPQTAARYQPQGAEVRDRITGLTWQRCSAGQTWDGSTCAGTASRLNWDDAVAWAQQQASASGQPWRLPNVKELATLTESQRRAPALDASAFPATPAISYWSSTYYTPDTYMAWAVNMASGEVMAGFRPTYAIPYHYGVRLVR